MPMTESPGIEHSRQHDTDLYARITYAACGLMVGEAPAKLVIHPDHCSPHMVHIFRLLAKELYTDLNTGLPNYREFLYQLGNQINERKIKRTEHKNDMPLPPDTIVFM